MKSGPTRDAARDGVQHAEDDPSVEFEALGHDPGRAIAPEHRREKGNDDADPNDRRQPVDGQATPWRFRREHTHRAGQSCDHV